MRICDHRRWVLHALNVRTNHVHLVVEAGDSPARVLNIIKSWCTRKLVEAEHVTRGMRVWTRGGSKRYLWTERDVASAARYVEEGQG